MFIKTNTPNIIHPAAAPSPQPIWRTAKRTGQPKRARSAATSRVKAFINADPSPSTATAVLMSAIAAAVPPPRTAPNATANVNTTTAMSSDARRAIVQRGLPSGGCSRRELAPKLLQMYICLCIPRLSLGPETQT